MRIFGIYLLDISSLFSFWHMHEEDENGGYVYLRFYGRGHKNNVY